MYAKWIGVSHASSRGKRNGTYAELMVASAKYVVLVPHVLNPLAAAPLTCAGVTPTSGITGDLTGSARGVMWRCTVKP